MAFKLASSPHLNSSAQTNRVMLKVILCTLPGVIAQCYFFGAGALIQVLMGISLAILTEACVLKLRQRPIKATLSDNSAALTGLLIGVAVPALAPWWIVVIGTLFAILVVKQLYGGLGNNIFNPAMAAYVMLLISFPVQMTTWVAPAGGALNELGLVASLSVIFQGASPEAILAYRAGFDGVTMATPLDAIKTSLATGLTIDEALTKNSFSDGFGIGWLWINIAYLAGGLVMLKLKLIRWHISIAVLLSLFVCASLGYMLSPDTHTGPLLHLFSGATMLAAFFIATDPVTAATSVKGRLIFGALIGILVYVIRTFGGYPDAFAFAILLANLCAPFIDYYVKPRAYGHRTSR
ncbi:electron transport complex subunit RsxD [Shewanella sp. Isolate11]|uniref:electron transport complex subunit RsxD n=1 Tax=Shewanella sp. Isolate11 TaxID=2908530 RepID=UPI001EFD58BE|nr:electron transport complex subunit RsxD [Shewanella sp. Isolate11]MCG9696580.1 electron transport complex subunit RsxD [Shewanella sp. Isolate11]